MLSRRKFLGAGSTAAIGAVFAAAPAAAKLVSHKLAGAIPAREKFEALVGTCFNVHREALAVVPIRLAEVGSPARLSSPLPANEAFSLVFEGPSSEPLAQQSYRIVHDEAGEMVIFIVPVGRRADALLYEAVFNLTPTRA